MKILYANGCSMTFGAELGGEIYNDSGDFIRDRDPKYRKDHSWPNVLSNSLNMKSFNDADGGSSNDKIFRKTLDWTSRYLMDGNDPHDLFIAIAWSHPSRREYKWEGHWVGLLPGAWSPKFKSEQILNNFHVEHFLDEICDSIYTLQYILSLQSWLKTNQIPYLFCNALHNAYHKKDASIDNMLFHIDRNRYFMIDDYYYCMHNECKKWPMGPRLHPLEEGHNHWAKLLQDFIETNQLLQHD